MIKRPCSFVLKNSWEVFIFNSLIIDNNWRAGKIQFQNQVSGLYLPLLEQVFQFKRRSYSYFIIFTEIKSNVDKLMWQPTDLKSCYRLGLEQNTFRAGLKVGIKNSYNKTRNMQSHNSFKVFKNFVFLFNFFFFQVVFFLFGALASLLVDYLFVVVPYFRPIRWDQLLQSYFKTIFGKLFRLM